VHPLSWVCQLLSCARVPAVLLGQAFTELLGASTIDCWITNRNSHTQYNLRLNHGRSAPLSTGSRSNEESQLSKQGVPAGGKSAAGAGSQLMAHSGSIPGIRRFWLSPVGDLSCQVVRRPEKGRIARTGSPAGLEEKTSGALSSCGLWTEGRTCNVRFYRAGPLWSKRTPGYWADESLA